MASFVENVNKVANLTPTNVEDLNLIVQSIDAINAVAPLANDLSDIINNIVPNLAEILEADNNATIAATAAAVAANLATVCAAYNSVDYAGFAVSDGDLLVLVTDVATATPSLVDGEFILTY